VGLVNAQTSSGLIADMILKMMRLCQKATKKYFLFVLVSFQKKQNIKEQALKRTDFFQRLPLWSKLSPERWSYLSESTAVKGSTFVPDQGPC
jgi:hypothetical protein